MLKRPVTSLDAGIPCFRPDIATLKEPKMKMLKIAVVASMLAAPAFAGGMSAPVMEPMITPEVIIEDTATSSSSGGILIPLLLVVLLAAAVSAN